MSIHEMSEEEFLRYIVSKPFDAVGSLEFMRLWGIANRSADWHRVANERSAEIVRLKADPSHADRNQLLLGVLQIVATHLQDVAQDPMRLERAQEFAKMQIEKEFAR